MHCGMRFDAHFTGNAPQWIIVAAMPPQDLVSVREARERTIAVLSDLFANDSLDVDEFERRVGLAHTAASVAEIEAIVADLQPASTALATIPKPAPVALVPADQVKRKSNLVAIMGGVQRKGPWTPPQQLRIVAMMGGAELDFREARLPVGTTEVKIWAVMGGIEIIVPPGLAVEVSGTAIMGGFDHMDRAPAQPDPGAPLLHIHGIAFMGGVSIETRLPGESAGDARRRRRKERKQLRGRS